MHQALKGRYITAQGNALCSLTPVAGVLTGHG